MTTSQLHALLVSKLTQADMRLEKRGQGNPHRLALWLERVPDINQSPEVFIARVKQNYFRDFSPAAFVVKAWETYKATGKVARITDKGGIRC